MISGIFFKQKPVRALASLANKERVWYASMLGKEIDCTYPHLTNILKVFEEEGLVVTHGQGRIKIIELTDKGDDLAHDLENILRRMDKISKHKAQEQSKEKNTEKKEKQSEDE